MDISKSGCRQGLLYTDSTAGCSWTSMTGSSYQSLRRSFAGRWAHAQVIIFLAYFIRSQWKLILSLIDHYITTDIVSKCSICAVIHAEILLKKIRGRIVWVIKRKRACAWVRSLRRRHGTNEPVCLSYLCLWHGNLQWQLIGESWVQLLVFVQSRMTQAMRISNTIQASSTCYVMKVQFIAWCNYLKQLELNISTT